MRRTRLSPRAARDLEEIGDFIARDSPARAVSFIEELLAKCDVIAKTPAAWPKPPGLALGVRRAVHQRYLLFYTVHARHVRIERILHGARDIDWRLFRQ